MTTIKITDQLGLDEDVTLASFSALLQYFKQLPALRLDNLDLAKWGGLTLDQPAVTMLSSGVSFSEPVVIGAGSPELLIQAGAHGTFALFKRVPGAKGLSDVLAGDIDIPQNDCYVSLGMDATVGVNVQAAVAALTFGVTPGTTAKIVNYRLFPLNQGVTLVDALRETVGAYLIPASADDLASLASGSVVTVTGTGTLTLRVTANLLAITNPLASLTLPAPLPSASVSAGGSVSIGASYQVEGSYQVCAQKLDNGKVRVGWYREESSQIQVSAAVSEGLSGGIGSTDLFSTIVGMISANPAADLQELAAAKLSDSQIAGINSAIKASVQRKLELSLSAQFSSKQSSDAVFLYEVDVAALTAESRQALEQGLHGDLSALHAGELPGISCVNSIWESARTTGLNWDVNLLGVWNVGSVATLTTSGKVLYDPATGALVVTDQATASRVQSEQVNFGADTQKLRHVMAESFLATAVYRGAEGKMSGPSLKFSHSYFDLVNQTGRDEMLEMLRTGVALGLLAGDEGEAPQDIADFGRTMVHATTDYDDRLATGMFLDSNGGPLPPGFYEQMGRNAVQSLVKDTDADAARLRPAVDDSLWAQMKEQGQPGFPMLFPMLSPPLVGAITADYSTIVWWADAMAEAAERLASIRQWYGANPAASVDDPKFQQLRGALADHLKQVAATTKEEFGQPWGLLAMYEAASRRSGAAITIAGPKLVRMKERALTAVANP
ncbi:hypothetical protein SBA3_3270004 [Candidatus Sulfopaludibacter sp. SbA3]|nr:hypothetical protein SBA3_3270004 [Candidatus Sulfopaludibacter sp. SbA3]